MNISYFKVKDEAYIIIGSDGLIGGYISQEIQNVASAKNLQWERQLLIQLDSYDDIEEQTLNIVNNQLMKSVTSCTVFCAHGKGGFSLKKKTAISQYNQYDNLLLGLNAVNGIEIIVVLISSLGAIVSNEKSVYKTLTLMKEERLKKYDFQSLAIRLPSLWGIKVQTNEPKGLVGCILDSLNSGKNFTVYGALETTRNYLYIETAVQEIMKILSNYKSSDYVSNLYNLRSRYYYCVGSILSIVKQVIPSIALVYTLKQSELLDRENHTNLAANGVDWIVDNCLNVEIKEAWIHLNRK